MVARPARTFRFQVSGFRFHKFWVLGAGSGQHSDIHRDTEFESESFPKGRAAMGRRLFFVLYAADRQVSSTIDGRAVLPRRLFVG